MRCNAFPRVFPPNPSSLFIFEEVPQPSTISHVSLTNLDLHLPRKQVGTLLAAAHALDGTAFEQAAVLVTEHGAAGTRGVILNQALPDLYVRGRQPGRSGGGGAGEPPAWRSDFLQQAAYVQHGSFCACTFHCITLLALVSVLPA